MKAFFPLAMAVSLLVSATGCGGSQSSSNAATNTPPIPATPSTIYAVDTTDQLYIFQSNAPGSVQPIGTVSGLQSGETIVGVTFTPEGVLFGLGSTGMLYQINPTDGTTTNVSPNGVPQIPMHGSDFGISLVPENPYFIRMTSDGGSNFHVTPGDGTVSNSDTALAYGSGDIHFGQTPHVITSASSCGCGGVIPTIYGIDDHTGSLITVGNVNANPLGAESGQVFTVGSLGVSVSGYATLSLPVDSQTAYSTISGASGTTLYKIDLPSGVATVVGAVSLANPIRTAVILPVN